MTNEEKRLTILEDKVARLTDLIKSIVEADNGISISTSNWLLEELDELEEC